MNLTLQPLLDAGMIKHEQKVLCTNVNMDSSSIQGTILHVRSNYLIISFIRTEKGPSLSGTIITITFESSTQSAQTELEVIHEESIYPVHLVGLIPVEVHITQKQHQKDSALLQVKEEKEYPLVAPDFIINVPFKVMGAKPAEEKGEGVVLELSPTTLVIGTDRYIAKGDFIKLSFMIPRTKQEAVVMTKAIEKRIENNSSVITLQITNYEEKHQMIIRQYYDKLLGK